MQSYARGVMYAVLAGVFLSFSGLIVRFIEHADPWLVLFYRSISFFVTLVVFMIVRNRRAVLPAFLKLKPTDLIVSVSLASGFIFYILSLFNTLVANTVLMLSTGPFCAALLGWVVLKEKIDRRTWIAMSIALAGIVIMVSIGTNIGDVIGYFYAFLAVLSFAIMIIVLRSAGERDMIAATAIAGIVAALISTCFIDSFAISIRDLLLSICTGCLQIGFGFILITLASKSVPAAQVALLALGETALAPIWVWLVINEVPTTTTIVGGVIVLGAIVYQGLAVEIRE